MVTVRQVYNLHELILKRILYKKKLLHTRKHSKIVCKQFLFFFGIDIEPVINFKYRHQSPSA